MDNSEFTQNDEELKLLRQSILPKLEVIIKISNTTHTFLGSDIQDGQSCLVVNSLRLLLRCVNCDNNIDKIHELTNKLSVQKNPEIYELLLNSNLKAKFNVIKKMLDNRKKNDLCDLELVESLSRFKAPLNAIAFMLKMMIFSVEEKEKIGEIFLRNRAEELFQYGIKKNLFHFSMRTAFSSLVWTNRLLNSLIDDHFPYYRELFNNNKLCVMRGYDIPKANSLLKTFCHRKFLDYQQVKCSFFKILFEDVNLLSGLTDAIKQGSEWFYGLFAVTIGYDVGLRLSQGTIDFAFSQLLSSSSLKFNIPTQMLNPPDNISQEIIWCCRLVVTMLWCGYTFVNTDNLNHLYEKTKSECVGSDIFDRLLHLIANSGQKQFIFLMKISNRNTEIMSLKSMARAAIRSQLIKPFRRSLSILLDRYPLLPSNYINLENEIIDLKLERIKFRIIKNKFYLLRTKLR